MILSAVVWHWWIAPVLVGGAVLLMVATLFGYLKQVVAQKYPPKGYYDLREAQILAAAVAAAEADALAPGATAADSAAELPESAADASAANPAALPDGSEFI